jgi:hypothetical protein
VGPIAAEALARREAQAGADPAKLQLDQLALGAARRLQGGGAASFPVFRLRRKPLKRLDR